MRTASTDSREVPGAILPSEDNEAENDFFWLDAIDEDTSYMPLDIQRPAKSLDFGKDGHTGSVTSWHELLQMTAPHDDCGVVFVRGDFPDSAESVLARAQRRNEKGTFGLGIHIKPTKDKTDQCVMDITPAQGMINMRWPCTRFNLVRNDQQTGAEVVASYTICSFSRKNSIFQVARITPTVQTSSSDSIDGGTNLDVKIDIDVGGMVRFGCSGSGRGTCSGQQCSFRDSYREVAPDANEVPYTLACLSHRHDKKLEARLWINRKPVDMRKWRHPCSTDGRIYHEPHDYQGEFQDEIFPFHAVCPWTVEDKAVTMVARLSLVDSDHHTSFARQPCISSADVQEYLGVSEDSKYAPYRLWSELLHEAPGRDATQLNAIGRCAESILSISAVPFRKRDVAAGDVPADPVIRRISTSAGSQRSRAISNASMGSSSRPCDYVALLRNIITPQVVDLQSTFWQVRFLIKAAKFFDKMPLRDLPESATTADKTKHKHIRAMQTAYQDLIFDKLRKICHWMLDIIPVLLLSSPQTLHYGILPSDVLCEPELRDLRRNCENPAQLISDLEERHESEKEKPTQPGHRTQKMKMKSQKWYGTLIIWYLLSQSPDHFADADVKAKLWERLVDMNDINNEDNRTDTIVLDYPYGCILRWYHSYCLTRICLDLQKEDPARFTETRIDLDKHKRLADHWQIKAEKSLRLFGQGRLRKRTLNYDVANLAMVGKELKVADAPILQQGQNKTCLEYARDLIQTRPDTTVLNPGRSKIVRWDANDIRSATPRPAPWELNCLGHHVPISLGVAANEEEIMEQCSHFLLSDYTFLGSLDQSKPTIISQWWDLMTSSIVCAQMLDDLTHNRRPSFMITLGSNEDLTMKNPIHRAQPRFQEDRFDRPAPRPADKQAGLTTKQPKLVRFDVGSINDQVLEHLMRRVQELEKKPYEEGDFVWTHRLPRPLYHADTAVQSLEDTPAVFRLKQTKNLEVRRNIQKHFSDRGVTLPDWRLQTVGEVLKPAMLRQISCVDFALTADANDAPEIGISCRRGRIALREQDIWNTAWGDEIDGQEFTRLLNTHGNDTGLLDLYFLGMQKKLPNFASLPPEFRRMLKNKRVRSTFLQEYQKSLFHVLNDSLVDLGTKYRILFLRDIGPATLQALIYMWHPDALDTFDNHLGILSSFSDETNQVSNGGDDMWITTITLSHWRLESKFESDIRDIEVRVETGGKGTTKSTTAALPRTDSSTPRDELAPTAAAEQGVADFPPKSVSDQRKQVKDTRNHSSKIRGLTISLVITGDPWGRYWTCSVLNELIDEKLAASLSAEIRDIMQMFIHQQYTGRTLVFLLLLGYYCESMATECENFTDELDQIMGMDPMVLLRGIEWHKSDVALKKLKEMMWGLEALRVFDDKLARALVQIKQAAAKLKGYAEIGEKIRHKDMKRDLQRVVEDFDKRHSRLENAHSAIGQRIDQGSKLREGITSVISVEQNENISMLTWVTIAYLPLAFVAGVFSMGHHIVPETAGWATFGWLMVVFVIGTVLFALSLQALIARLRRVEMGLHNVIDRQKPAAAGPLDTGESGLWTMKGLSKKLPKMPLRRRKRQTVKEDEESALE